MCASFSTQGLDTCEPGPTPDEPSSAKPARHTRRLFDKLLLNFHHACDVGDLEVAAQLLPILGMMTTRRQRSDDSSRRRSIEGLVAAHERLWHLRHPVEG